MVTNSWKWRMFHESTKLLPTEKLNGLSRNVWFVVYWVPRIKDYFFKMLCATSTRGHISTNGVASSAHLFHTESNMSSWSGVRTVKRHVVTDAWLHTRSRQRLKTNMEVHGPACAHTHTHTDTHLHIHIISSACPTFSFHSASRYCLADEYCSL